MNIVLKKTFFTLSIRLLLIAFLSSCHMMAIEGGNLLKEKKDTGVAEQTSDSVQQPPPASDSGKEQFVATVKAAAHTKNFNQINMTYSKLTKIPRGNTNVIKVMDGILNQLPSGYSIEAFSPFQQISMTRLAFTYCDLFIDQDNDFKALNYDNISDEQIASKLMNRFLDMNGEVSKFDVMKSEVISTLANEPVGSVGKLVDESRGQAKEVKKRLTKMSCTLVLSSPFVTFI